MAGDTHRFDDPCAVHSLRTEGADPRRGGVRWNPLHSAWNGGMLLAAAIFAPIFCSWSAIGVFVVATGATLLLGHSVG